MKLNASKYQLLICGHRFEHMICNVRDAQIIESYNVTLLGVLVDSELNFNAHLNCICKKASNKINALSRQCAFLPFFSKESLYASVFQLRI